MQQCPPPSCILVISPNATVAGLVGCVVGAVAIFGGVAMDGMIGIVLYHPNDGGGLGCYVV